MHLGILGGGQLGQMLALAGIPLGMRFRFLDPAPDAPPPAAAVGEHHRADFTDTTALDRFADGLDLVTFEFENVPVEAVRHLAKRLPTFPPAEALETGQDRLAEKTLFRSVGMNVHDFRATQGPDELRDAAHALGLPVVIKTRRMGYDGKGQAVLRTEADIAQAALVFGETPMLVEKFVPFDRELSLIAVRGRRGEFRAYPLVHNVHKDGILRVTTAPAPNVLAKLQSTTEAYAQKIMDRLNYVGVLAIEFFEHNGQLLVNEMAPRVHNSGHWTIEGSVTSQFENHLRAVAGLPLGDTQGSAAASVMFNLIGDAPPTADILAIPGTHLHLYGKDPRPGRKIGHVTITGDSAEAIRPASARLTALIEAAS
jgi:5-(carboxyamino)imidazole ribonucleotide synthase